MCNYVPNITGAKQHGGNEVDTGIAVTNDHSIYISISGITTLTDLKTWLATNEVYVSYALIEPNYYDLTAEELATFATLHTNYPNTTVYNDAGAGMEVKYVADTKLYIDKKFAELSTALLNQ